jgi:hypothetical protein
MLKKTNGGIENPFLLSQYPIDENTSLTISHVSKKYLSIIDDAILLRIMEKYSRLFII